MHVHFKYSLPLLTAVVLVFAACDESPQNPMLDGTGERRIGSIVGQLEFIGETAPFPVANVLAFSDLDTECVSDHGTIHVTGDFTGWDSEAWAEPGMQKITDCLWFDTKTLPAGAIEWKFITDAAWDPSYGAGTNALTGDAALVSGEGTQITASAPEAGDYVFILDESTSPVSFEVLPKDEAPITDSQASNGTFRVGGLTEGTYQLLIDVEGFVSEALNDVVVSDDSPNIDLGTITLVPIDAMVSGTVSYEGDAVTTTIVVTDAGTMEERARATAEPDGSFVLTGLSAGRFDFTLMADGYLPAVVSGIEFTGANLDLGTVQLSLALGAITGSVVFADSPSSPPDATVEVVSGTTVIASTTTTGAFTISDVAAGTVDVRITAPAYTDGEVPGVVVEPDQTVDIGSVTLDRRLGIERTGSEEDFTDLGLVALEDDTGDTQMLTCFELGSVPVYDLGRAYAFNTADSLYVGVGYQPYCFGDMRLGLAIDVGTPAGGSTDPEGRRIIWETANLPDFIVYTELDEDNVETMYEWNGSTWAIALGGAPGGPLGIVDNDGNQDIDFFEIALPLSALGIGSGDTIGFEMWTLQSRNFPPVFNAPAFDLLVNDSFPSQQKSSVDSTIPFVMEGEESRPNTWISYTLVTP